MPGRELTGNHYLSLPVIERAGAAIPQVTALHSGLAGLLSWAGEPLLRAELEVDGHSIDLGQLAWERLDRWIPRAAGRAEECDVALTVCAPPGYEPLVRGGFLGFELKNLGRRARVVRAKLAVHWRGTDLQVRAGRPLPGERRLAGCSDLPGVALEVGRAPLGAALGIGGGGEETLIEAGAEGGEARQRSGEWECSGQPGGALLATLTQERDLPAGGSTRLTFLLGLGRDRDSALATVAQLARLGPETLLRRGRLALAQLTRRLDDPELNELLNRNLLFNHFFALGRGLDDDRLHAVSSRSPLHGTTAQVNERETLFWTLPAITLNDPFLARELLVQTLEAFSGAPGQPARYLDGGILAPGEVLDQLLAYPLALDRYSREAEDETLVEDPLVQDVLRELDAVLYNRLHREVLLAETELLSAQEPADFPYPTFGNVLLWCYAQALPRVWRGEEGEPPASFDGAAEEIAAAIWQRCTVSVDGVPVLVSSTNLGGEAAVYDDPVASLALLPYLGFCAPDDPLWRNTMELLHSPAYPLWHGSAPHPGLASRRSPRVAALAGLVAELLGPDRERALRTLRSLELPDGVAAEQYDPETGKAAAEPHAAALAGFLAWALDRGAPPPKTKRKR